jgi:hypothetical protein
MSATTPIVLIELYDTGVRIGDGKNILTDSISCALIESDNILVGEQAEHQTHLRPREISTNFWGQLSKNSETKHVVSNANIALGHLEHACKAANCSTQAIILITPITLDKQDLGLLLGICKKLSLNVVGIVCNAALAMQQRVDNCKAVFLDLLQQKLAVTELIQNDSSVSLKQPSRVIDYGLQNFITHCAKAIANKFVSETRFDPLHSSNDEQLFFDMLPIWLRMLEDNNSIECKLNTAEKHFSINIDRQYLQQANQKLYDEVAAHLNVLFHNHESIAIYCSSTCIQAFGLLEYLSDLPGCAVMPLAKDSIINHALHCRDEIISNEQIHYVNTLSWQEDAVPIALRFNAGRLSNITSKPTHLLIDGHAYSLQKSLFISSDDANTSKVMRHEEAQALCKISADNMNIAIQVLVDNVISINNNSIERAAFANIGDVLTIKNFQTDYVFIKVVQNET